MVTRIQEHPLVPKRCVSIQPHQFSPQKLEDFKIPRCMSPYRCISWCEYVEVETVLADFLGAEVLGEREVAHLRAPWGVLCGLQNPRHREHLSWEKEKTHYHYNSIFLPAHLLGILPTEISNWWPSIWNGTENLEEWNRVTCGRL